MKIFKLTSICASLFLVFMFLSSCTSNGTLSAPPETGYHTGQIQKEYIYYNGILWEYDMYTPDKQRLTQLPQDAYLIGKTVYEDSYEIPCQDFYTSHIDVNLNVYLDPPGEAIYIEYQNTQTIYYRFIPSKDISNNNVSTQTNITLSDSETSALLFTEQCFSESHSCCFIIEGAGNTRSSQQINPILVFESESTYSLFLSAFSSIAPHGSYVIHDEHIKLSTSETTDAFVFRITNDVDGNIQLYYDRELSQSQLFDQLNLGSELVFSRKVCSDQNHSKEISK